MIEGKLKLYEYIKAKGGTYPWHHFIVVNDIELIEVFNTDRKEIMKWRGELEDDELLTYYKVFKLDYCYTLFTQPIEEVEEDINNLVIGKDYKLEVIVKIKNYIQQIQDDIQKSMEIDKWVNVFTNKPYLKSLRWILYDYFNK